MQATGGPCVPLLQLLALMQPPPAPAPAPNPAVWLSLASSASFAPLGAPAAGEAPGQVLVGGGNPLAGMRTASTLFGGYPAVAATNAPGAAAPVAAQALPPARAPSPASTSTGA